MPLAPARDGRPGMKSGMYRRCASLDCIERAIEVPFSLPDAGRHDKQPISGSAGSPHVLAQVLARLEMPCGGLEVALLRAEAAQSHVHVRRGPAGLARHALPTVGMPARTSGIAHAAVPGRPDVRRGLSHHRAHQRGCQTAAPAPSQRREIPMRGLEVPARPCVPSEERLCCPAEEIVVLGEPDLVPR